jgi:hypothetical protein
MSLVYKKSGTYVILANTLSGHTALGGQKATGITFDWVQIKIDTTQTDVNQTGNDQFRAQLGSINSAQGTLIGWGDGTVSNPRFGASVDPVHTYPSNGIYRVRYGRLQGFAKGIQVARAALGNDVLDNRKIKDIERCGQFSKIPWGSNSFKQADFTATFSANDFPDVSLAGNVDIIGVFSLQGAFAESTIETLPSTFTMAGSSGFSAGEMFKSCANFDGEVGNITGVIYHAGGLLQSCASYNNNGSSAINNLNFDFSGYATYVNGGLGSAFESATSFNQPIGNWDISDCITLGRTFKNATAFNQDIGSWDVGSVLSLAETFNNADGFNNGDTPNTPGGGVGIGMDNWRFQTATGIPMFYCFASNGGFNQYIGSWNLKVNNLDAAFNASKFNNGSAANVSGGGVGIGMDNWDVSLCGNMNYVFGASPFNQYIGSWNTASLTTCFLAFSNNQFNHDISTKTINPGTPDEYIAWDMSGVTNMSQMFAANSAFNQNIGNWDTSSVVTTGFYAIFSGASSFNNLGVGGIGTGLDNWNVSGAYSFAHMFWNSAFNQEVRSWSFRPSNSTGTNSSVVANKLVDSLANFVTDQITTAFYVQNTTTKVNANVTAVTATELTLSKDIFTSAGDGYIVFYPITFDRMFQGTPFNKDISGWDVQRVTVMSSFLASTPFAFDLSSWDVSNCRNLSYFGGQNQTTTFASWNTINCSNFSQMFNASVTFNENIGNWDLRNASNMINMFVGATALTDANVENILVGWNNSVNTAEGVNATGLFGNRTMNQTTYAAGKAAYDNLATAVGSGGKGWNLTNAITWV